MADLAVRFFYPSIATIGRLLPRTSGLLAPAPSAPVSDAIDEIVDEVIGYVSVAYAFSVLPLVVSVQISSFWPKSAGDAHAEGEPVAAWEQVRRLALIRSTRLNVVVGAHRHFDLFFPVAVHVAEKES